jgi:hypothetical protein
VFAYQEKIDFKTLFRYKKASTEKEEACQWDSVEALSKENPLSVKYKWVKRYP